MGGGGYGSMEPTARSPLDDFVLEIARERRGAGARQRPRVCFIGTATGDAAPDIERFHAAFDDAAQTSHLTLFDRTVVDIEAFLVAQDVIYVGGGNTASMLAVWRAHGVDAALRRSHDAGVVLTGRSAGSICWFESGTTDSYGLPLQAVHGALGLIAGSHSPHYDGEVERRPTYHGLIASGALPDGLAADDGAALVFDGPVFLESIAERSGAGTYQVALADGAVVEEPLPVRRLS